jgi:hypothetical protein
MRTDEQTDTTKLTVPLPNFRKAPKNYLGNNTKLWGAIAIWGHISRFILGDLRISGNLQLNGKNIYSQTNTKKL